MQTRPSACFDVATIGTMWKIRASGGLIRVFRDNSIVSTRRENMPFTPHGQGRFFTARKFFVPSPAAALAAVGKA
jgi:hypothetical protein